MAETFDPYYRWLSIPPKDQPPNHYRLLGIELFESELDVIEQAADRQMAYLRMFKTGPHAALSQKLLNEVAAAKICLLRPEKRADYNRQLAERLKIVDRNQPAAPTTARATARPPTARARPADPMTARSAPLAARAVPVHTSPAPLVDLDALPTLTRPSRVVLTKPSRPQPRWQSPLFVVPACAFVVCTLLVAALLSNMPDDRSAAQQNPVAASDAVRESDIRPGREPASQEPAVAQRTEAAPAVAQRTERAPPPTPDAPKPSPTPATPTPPPTDPAKQLPALVKRLGGQLHPASPSTFFVDLKKTRPRREDLAELASFDNVASIDLQDTPVEDAQIDALASCRKLDALNLSGTRITAAGLAALRSLPLKWLYLSRTALDDRAVAHLGPLKILTLSGCPITDAAAAALARLNINDLAIDGTKITDAGLEALSHSHITRLNVARTRISSVGLRHLARIAGLRQLDVSGCAIGAAELDAIRALPNLDQLLMADVRFSGGALARLNGHPRLRNLWLADCVLNDTELAALDDLPNLDTISVDRTAVTDQGFAALSRFEELTNAFANQSAVTRSGAVALFTRCPSVTTLSPSPDLLGAVATIPAVEINSSAAGQETPFAGGNGGQLYRIVNKRRLLCGIECEVGYSMGNRCLKGLLPIFDRRQARHLQLAAVAKEGYSVGAINVSAGSYVEAIQVVFMRVRDDESLDPADSYLSDWLGIRGQHAAGTLSGGGAPIIGLSMRQGLVLEAVALVYAPRAQ